MTHPSVNSIVERRKTFNKWFVDNHADPDGKFTHMPKWLKADLRKAWDAATAEAATIISELQAENERLTRLSSEMEFYNKSNIEAARSFKARALAAESSLSRIKEETEKMLHNADAALGEATAILGGEYGDHYGTLCDRMMQLADDLAAIGSLGSTGGAEAEEGSTQKEGSR